MTAETYTRCNGCRKLFAGCAMGTLALTPWLDVCSAECAAAVARQMWIDSVAEGDVDPTLQKEVKSQ